MILVLKVIATLPCSGASCEADPWIPLTVSWQVTSHGGPLNLYVRGDDGGYVELKVDPDTGALSKAVVIDLPPLSYRSPDSLDVIESGFAPALDRMVWDWNVTPDYIEPVKRDVDRTQHLSYSKSDGIFSLWFSEAQASRYVKCGDVRVGVSERDELVCVVVPSPPISAPAGYPGE